MLDAAQGREVIGRKRFALMQHQVNLPERMNQVLTEATTAPLKHKQEVVLYAESCPFSGCHCW